MSHSLPRPIVPGGKILPLDMLSDAPLFLLCSELHTVCTSDTNLILEPPLITCQNKLMMMMMTQDLTLPDFPNLPHGRISDPGHHPQPGISFLPHLRSDALFALHPPPTPPFPKHRHKIIPPSSHTLAHDATPAHPLTAQVSLACPGSSCACSCTCACACTFTCPSHRISRRRLQRGSPRCLRDARGARSIGRRRGQYCSFARSPFRGWWVVGGRWEVVEKVAGAGVGRFFLWWGGLVGGFAGMLICYVAMC